MRLASAATGLALLFALSAGSARAQGRDAAAADALFREARALLKRGDFQTACPKLAESQRLDPAAGTAINLGDCWEKVGKLADALQSYRDALDLLKPGDHRLGPAKEQITALEKRVPKLTIRLAPGAPEGTKVKRDDVELGGASLGVALPVNPGEHWVVVAAPGRADNRRKITLAEGKNRELVMEIGERHVAPQRSRAAKSQASPQESGATSPEDTSRRDIGYLAGGLGLLGAAIALPTYFYAKGKEQDARDGDTKAKQDGEAAAPVFYASAGVAVVGLAVGGYLLLSGGDNGRTAVSVQASTTGLCARVGGDFW